MEHSPAAQPCDEQEALAVDAPVVGGAGGANSAQLFLRVLPILLANRAALRIAGTFESASDELDEVAEQNPRGASALRKLLSASFRPVALATLASLCRDARAVVTTAPDARDVCATRWRILGGLARCLEHNTARLPHNAQRRRRAGRSSHTALSARECRTTRSTPPSLKKS